MTANFFFEFVDENLFKGTSGGEREALKFQSDNFFHNQDTGIFVKMVFLTVHAYFKSECFQICTAYSQCF